MKFSVDANGALMMEDTNRTIRVDAEQIAKHRRDKDFEAALQAAAGAVGAAPELVALAASK